ncbi:MAG TPA: hypothetical protein VEK13_06245 [Thermoplasmata archaeon]|nr:hypothetical protein [Thermoplasmata archaeon]
MPDELLYETREKIVSVTLHEITPQGVRLTWNLQGQVVGRYNAARIETVKGLLKPDGTSEFELLIADRTNEGEMILARGNGAGSPMGGAKIRVEGTASFMTASKKLAWLNSVKARFEGSADLDTGDVLVKVYSVT